MMEFKDNIVALTIKENAEVSMEAVKEMIAARQELVAGELYGVLVDGNSNFYVSKKVREEMAKYTQHNRVAVAVVSTNMASRLIANFFISVNKPKTPTRLFNTRKEAESWLRSHIEPLL